MTIVYIWNQEPRLRSLTLNLNQETKTLTNQETPEHQNTQTTKTTKTTQTTQTTKTTKTT